MSDAQIHHRCADAVACPEVTARYVAAAQAHQDGAHDIAEMLNAAGDRHAQVHGLWDQLEQDVAT
jgi:hypothetical protein